MKYVGFIIGSIIILIILSNLLFPVLGWLFHIFLVAACIVGIVTIIKKLKK